MKKYTPKIERPQNFKVVGNLWEEIYRDKYYIEIYFSSEYLCDHALSKDSDDPVYSLVAELKLPYWEQIKKEKTKKGQAVELNCLSSKQLYNKTLKKNVAVLYVEGITFLPDTHTGLSRITRHNDNTKAVIEAMERKASPETVARLTREVTEFHEKAELFERNKK